MVIRVSLTQFTSLHKKTKLSIKDFFSKCDQYKETDTVQLKRYVIVE